MAAQRPVYFDGRQLRRLSGAEFLDDAVLSTNVMFADGTRAFTGTVAGVTPTVAAHLATKGYTDDAVLDGPWNAPVEDIENTPPGGPSVGQRWVVGTSPTGAWAGQANNIAVWRGLWVFLTPTEGWTTFNRTTDAYIRFDGAAWVGFASAIPHGSLNGLQGGTSGQYFHLTSAEHTALTTSQAQRLFYATPTGGAGVPAMRTLALTDIPVGAANQFLRTVGGAVVWGTVTAATIGAVPATRAVNTGAGLSGGGDLSTDRTLTWNGVAVEKEGTAVGTRRNIDIVGGRADVVDDDPDVRITLPDPALMAMVFGG